MPHDAWHTLANTYAHPSRGHIKQLKDNLKISPKTIKTKSDELAALGKPLDHENIIEKVLEGLDNTYQSVIDAVNSRDTPITFDELHEKLIHKELSLRHNSPSLALPASAHLAHTRSNPRSATFRPSGPVNKSATPTNSYPIPSPYSPTQPAFSR
ncbi:hypothetical protein F511_11845 [Dorcoceras hygrometricum]|uniref:Uncharacterized protein n=1 Tax=Dorcoceras hygrometricum TaxID=472368 RepID=A0A2Z7BA18_9LAMI|nr:hypothetical protein F511_11845 [Dorcoceras hygrometricum]